MRKNMIRIISSLLSLMVILASIPMVDATVQVSKDKSFIATTLATEDEVNTKSFNVFLRKNRMKTLLENDGESDSIQWSSSPSSNVHEQIINYANSNADVTIPSKYLSVVKTICNWCDSKWKASGDKPFRAVHGSGNYIATLKYMWYFTKKIAKHSTGDNLATDISNADVYAASKVITPPSGDRLTVYNQMRNMTKRVLNAHAGNVSSNQTEAGRCKYIMYGLLMHLFGDLYAHRPLIPKKALTISDSTKKIKQSDFYTVQQAAALSTSEKIYKSWEDVKTDVTNQIVTFTGIRNYQKDESNTSLYEDNVNFYPNRLKESKIIAAMFLDDYSDGYYHEILDSIYGYSLHNYNMYINELGE